MVCGISSDVSLRWDAVSGAASYKLFFGSSSRDYGLIPIDLGNVTSQSYTGIPDGNYYLAVTASDGVGNSPYSDEQQISIRLPAPVNFNASVSGSTVNLSWDAADGADGYKLCYGLSTGDYIGSLDLGNVTSKEIPDVPNGTYYIVLTAYSGLKESGYSSEKDITVGAGTP